MSFALREHTADVAVEATADTLDGVFGAVADGLTACMLDGPYPPPDERFRVAVTAESLEALLFDFLDRLIIERDIRNVLPVEHAVSIDRREDDPTMTAEIGAISLEHVSAREVKAVTYSEMTLERRNGDWYAYVVFDV